MGIRVFVVCLIGRVCSRCVVVYFGVLLSGCFGWFGECVLGVLWGMSWISFWF